ncbi:MAG: yjeF-like protein hydroxyethylthiazole kinaserelated [Actinomycetia bacterium]|nr:yjeF-like protein hydroxyethylthiazole kinaserelated [Actinomycetes bacterium]
MQPVVTPEEMAAADAATIAAGTPQAVLMERAGRAVARATLRRLGGAYGRRTVVVCGKGSNGGDGLVSARALRRAGARVAVFRLADGVDREDAQREFDRADGFVDAMYGTGFHGELDGDAAWVASAFDRSGAPVIAVDIPSGVDGATGAVQGAAVQAALTVVFAAHKPAHCFEPGRSHCGTVELVDIGVDVGPRTVNLIESHDVARSLGRPKADAHKWNAAVMVVGGSAGMTGAPQLATRAALRAGAGMTWCYVPGKEAAARASGTEGISRALPATADGALALEAAKDVLDAVGRFGALVIGPGLGTADATVAAVHEIVRNVAVPVLVDADGLNALAQDSSPLEDRRRRGLATVLTPHGGEYKRLMGHPVGDDRLAAARALVDRTGAVVVLKGPGTVIAAPDGRIAINPTGGPELATAGTGDVLSGIVGAFIARGLEPFAAAAAAVFVHGRAADRVGPGMLASDLPDALPPTLATLGDG